MSGSSSPIREPILQQIKDEPIDEKNMPATEEAMADLFDEIDVAYFLENGFNATDYELQKMLGVELEIDEIERERFKLKRQMQIVSKKVSALIMQNEGFGTQVENYSVIRAEATSVLGVVTRLRETLRQSRLNCLASLSLVAIDRRKRFLFDLRRELGTVRTLYESEYRLRELIQEGDFPVSIQLCVEAINAAGRYSHYTCVRELSAKLSKVLGSMEAHIDDALATMTVVFNEEKYALVNSAYRMLGKLEGAAVKLQSFFRATIESTARSVMTELLTKASPPEGGNCPDLSTLPYEELCQLVETKDILRDLSELGRVLCRVLHVYHRVLRFHMQEDQERLLLYSVGSVVDGTADEEGADPLDAPLIVEKGVLQKSLIDNLYAVFGSAARKFNILLCSLDLASLKFDQFIRVVEISNRFRRFGRKFFGNACAEVALTIDKQTNAYFGRYHLDRMEELKMFLESEAFALCPVSLQFTLFDLPEFRFLKESTDAFDFDEDRRNFPKSQTFTVGAEALAGSYGEQLDFVLLDEDKGSVAISFDLPEEEASPTYNGNSTSSDSHVSKALEKHTSATFPAEKSFSEGSSCENDSSFAEDDDDRFVSLQNSMPNLCNTALNLLRFFARYIRMASTLRSMSEPAIFGIVQLYKYFLYSIFGFFCSDSDPQQQLQTFGINFASLRLRNLLDSIRAAILFSSGEDCFTNGCEKQNDFSTDASFKRNNVPVRFEPVQTAHFSLRLDSADSLFSLAERIVGVESLIFLTKQLELLRPVLESLVPVKKRNQELDHFYKTVLPVAVDLRDAAFGCVAGHTIQYPGLVKQVLSVNWEIGELQSQHSAYVDALLSEFALFKQKLVGIAHYAHISQELHVAIWSMLLLCTFRTLVQGYSEASRKCSNEGRALMLLDCEHLCREFETITALRPLPHRHYLDNYIKAFYLPPEELNRWIVHHTEYSLSQTSALLNVWSSSSSNSVTKRAKSRLMNILESPK